MEVINILSIIHYWTLSINRTYFGFLYMKIFTHFIHISNIPNVESEVCKNIEIKKLYGIILKL